MTSGVVALLVEASRSANGYPSQPSLSLNAIKAILQYTAVDVRDDTGLSYNPLWRGAGALNGAGSIPIRSRGDRRDMGRRRHRLLQRLRRHLGRERGALTVVSEPA